MEVDGWSVIEPSIVVTIASLLTSVTVSVILAVRSSPVKRAREALELSNLQGIQSENGLALRDRANAIIARDLAFFERKDLRLFRLALALVFLSGALAMLILSWQFLAQADQSSDLSRDALRLAADARAIGADDVADASQAVADSSAVVARSALGDASETAIIAVISLLLAGVTWWGTPALAKDSRPVAASTGISEEP